MATVLTPEVLEHCKKMDALMFSGQEEAYWAMYDLTEEGRAADEKQYQYWQEWDDAYEFVHTQAERC